MKHKELIKVVPPENLLFLAAAAAKSADVALTVHGHLARAVATTVCSDPVYLQDVLVAMCACAGEDDAAAAVLPPLSAGSLAPSGTLLELHKPHGVATARDPLGENYLVHTCRRDLLGSEVVLGVGDPLPEHSAEVRGRLAAILSAYGAECQFKRTGDRYVHLLVRHLLPAWASGPLSAESTPFPVAAKLLGPEANDTLRPLINLDAQAEMAELEKGPAEAHTPARLCIAAVLIEEMCGGGPHVVLGDDAALLADRGAPRLCVLPEMGLPAGAGWGVAASKELRPGTDVYQTILGWLSLASSDPSQKGLRDLWQAATLGHGVLVGGNTVAKYLPCSRK